jgi:ABC-type multidrug transport system permease subunit
MTAVTPDLTPATSPDGGAAWAGTADVHGRPGAGAAGPGRLSALGTLVRRRLALSARTPRELLVPLLTPVLFAIVIAPALDAIGPSVPGVDYMTFAALGTAGLLIPINCMFAGVGVIVDRESGARRDLLAAPTPRGLVVAGNLVVALLLTALQLGALMGASVLRGADLDATAAGFGWFVGAAVLLAIGMYGLAETVANRTATLEEYTGALPGFAIVPFFFAGSLFPIGVLPAALTAFAKALPLTHALALMRYGLVDRQGTGLHDIWGMDDPTVMAALSLAVVAVFAVALTAVGIRTFTRSAVR